MFGANQFGQSQFGQGASTIYVLVTQLIRAGTRAVSGFLRYTRRIS